MNSQMFLQDLLATVDRLQARPCCRVVAIVPMQVGPGLFALEDGGEAKAGLPRSIGGDVGAITALRQGNLQRGDRITIFLRPDERETLQLQVRFALAGRAWLVIPSGAHFLPVILSGAQRTRRI